MPRTRIVADERERACAIPELLKSQGARVDYAQLYAGDYIVAPRAAVERKSLPDLLASVYDGRLFKQCEELSSRYSKAFLMVEGSLDGIRDDIEHLKVIYGAIASIVSRGSLQVIFTPSEIGTCLALLSLSRHLRRWVKPGPLIEKPVKGKQLNQQQLYLIASLPGVGPTLSERLLRALGSPRRVFTAEISEMAKVPGMGFARSSRIKKVLTLPYRLEEEKGRQARLPEADSSSSGNLQP